MIIFWGDDHAFWTVAMLYHTSWSKNQNKLVPTRILQIAQTNSFTWVTSWIVKVVWKRLSNHLQTTSAEICGEASALKCHQFLLTESFFLKIHFITKGK